jgi:hypothetical protein
VTYTVNSLNVQPTAEQLATAPEPSANLRKQYTEVPKSLPAVVADTARTVTAGSTSHYEQAVKLQDYFAVSGGFQYDTQVDVGTGRDAIAKFLRDKQGFCVHFSFAMAAMARTLGIPARVAVGFAPGTPEANGTVSVGLKDAHAWPELYFEGVGWTRFEPTPNRGSVPSYTQSTTPGSDIPDPAGSSAATSAAPSTAPSTSASCTAQLQKLEGCASQAPAIVAGDDSDGPWWYVQVVLISLGVLLLLTIPFSPLLWRTRMRSVRLGAHGRTEAEAAIHTLAVWEEVTDTAWDFGISPDDSLTPRKAAARIVRLGQLDPPSADSVHRVADAVEQVLYAPRPQLAMGLAKDARRVIVGFQDTADRPTELRALLAPRSTVRVVWALSAWWTSVTTRAAALRPNLRKPSGQQG